MGTWSEINSWKNDARYVNPAFGSPLTVTGLSGLQVGDVLVVYGQFGSDLTAIVSFTDNATSANTYHMGASFFSSGHSQGGLLAASVVTDASATSVSMQWTGGSTTNFQSVRVAQWRHSDGPVGAGNPWSGTPVVAFQTTPGTGTDAISSGNTTTLVNGCLVTGVLMYPGSTTTTAVGTNYILTEDDLAGAQIYVEHLTQTSAGAIAATFTGGGGQDTITHVGAIAPPVVSIPPSAIIFGNGDNAGIATWVGNNDNLGNGSIILI